MPIYKSAESGTWFVDFTLANGKRVRRSAKTKDRKKAQELHDKLKAEAWRIERLGDTPEHSFDEACVLYLKSCVGLRDYESKVDHIRYWLTHFKGRSLRSLTTDAIMQAVPTLKRVQSGPPLPMSGATKNRYLATLSKLLNICAQRRWIESAPYLEKFKEAPVRESFLTREQARDLLAALQPGWMQDVTTFALMTGMRAGEILSLEWSQVDLQRGLVSVLASKAKSGSSRPVPLNETARQVIARRAGLNDKFVFSRCDVETFEIDRGIFKRALKDAGLPNTFRFHDLRHTWASWHAQAGTPLLMLQRAGGWKTLAMLNKYAHLNADHLAAMSSAVDIGGKIQAGFAESQKQPHLRIA
jgi:integrase